MMAGQGAHGLVWPLWCQEFFGAIAGYVCWFANPLIVNGLGCGQAKRRRVVIWGGAFARPLCLSFLGHDSILVWSSAHLRSLVWPGFWFWSLAPLLMTIYGLLMPESEGRHAASDPARGWLDSQRCRRRGFNQAAACFRQ